MHHEYTFAAISQNEDFSLFGIGIGLLAPLLDFDNEGGGWDEADRSGYGIGSNFTLGYSSSLTFRTMQSPRFFFRILA